MGMLDFWHPVFRSQDVPRGGVVAVKLAGRALAVFRTKSGELGAVEDVCPHRRMRLSAGRVKDSRLACAYHGWTFGRDGQGESPGTPKLHACVESFDCREAHRAVWVKGRGADRPLPAIEVGDFLPVGVVVHRVRAPLELVLDNFSEVEHTIAMHDAFGIDPDRSHEAVVTFEPSERAVSVRNTGPAKAPRFLARLILLFRRRFLFHSDYTILFEPPMTVVDHRWTDPVTGREAMVKYRLHHFFVPEDVQATRLVTFCAVRSRWPVGPAGGVRPFAWYMRKSIKATVDEDVWLLENLADQGRDLDGMKLSRFDRVLGLTRERLRRIYYGEAGAPAPEVESAAS
jgi:phenylpropionate dioxygenase-like ring-hydroxylating dioxygenase large terminal subunit